MKKILCVLCNIMLFMTGCVPEFANLGQPAEVYNSSYDTTALAWGTPTGGAAHFGMSLNMAMRNPKTLNPLINQDRSVDRVLGLIFEPLVEVRENMRPAPNLASRIVFSGDGMSAVVTLREDAFWSDGFRVTSGDVAFSVGVINSDIGSNIYREVIRDIAGIEIINNENFRVRFTRPQGGMSFGLAFPVIPRHYFEGHINFTSHRNMAPVGNGVFAVESFEPVVRLTLVPNESRTIRNRPYIQRAYVLITDSEETDFMAFEQGIINVMNVDLMAFGRFSGARAVSVTAYDTNNFVFLGFNFNNRLLANKGVREAIAHTVNREHILNNIYLGVGREATTVINPASHFYRPNSLLYEYSMEQARNVLFQIGVRDHEREGVLSKELDGQFERLEFRLLVNVESPERVAIAHALRSNLEELGMIVHLDIYDFETYLERLSSGNFDMFLGSYNFSTMPDLRPLFHSSAIGAGAYNYFAFSCEQVDELLERVAGALNEEVLWHAINDLQELIAYELPLVSIMFGQSVLLTDARISGDKRPVMNNVFNSVERWRLD